MSYRIEVNRKVAKSIEKLPKKEVVKIISKITALAEDPYPPNSKKMLVPKKMYTASGRVTIG